jgi:hypothetical protein
MNQTQIYLSYWLSATIMEVYAPDQTLLDDVTGGEAVGIKPDYEVKGCIISDQRLFR